MDHSCLHCGVCHDATARRPPERLPVADTMSAHGFVISHAKDASFEGALRSYYGYRDLGIRRANGER